MNIQLLMTGNELMSGDIIDSNSVMIADKLKNIGLTVKRKVTVADDLPDLVNEITHITQYADVLIINGGLGPTTDDLTAEALAKAANLPLSQHAEALEHLSYWCEKRGYALTGSNLKQAMLPQHCQVLANTVGSAVGFSLSLNECLIMCTPGVPSELAVMLDNVIIPHIKQNLPKNALVHTSRLQVFGYGESALQNMFSENFPDWPQKLDIGYRASLPFVELKITSQTAADKKLKQQWLSKIENVLGEHIVHVITEKSLSMAKCLLNELQQNNKTITTAESCTGGLIASLITKEAGASAHFHAGFVTYDNNIKQHVLGVDEATLIKHGAVSQAVVKEMAFGALQRSSSDIVIAVTGIAGPEGGTTDKPVGTVWIAWGTEKQLQTTCLQIKTNRENFQIMVANIALDLVRRQLRNNTSTPRYLIDRKAKT